MAGPAKNSSELSAAKQALLELRLQKRRESVQATAVPRRQPGDGPFPQSSAQQRLSLLQQLHPSLCAYNVGRVMRIRGQLDADALDAALAGIVERHAAIRTALSFDGGVAVQHIRAAGTVRMERIDLVSASDPESAALRLVRDELRRPCDLQAGLLLRARLLRVAPEEHILALVLHHAASDEDSKGILFAELAQRYDAGRLGRAV